MNDAGRTVCIVIQNEVTGRIKSILGFATNSILATVSLFVSVTVFINMKNLRPGLELYFLVPLVFSVCLIWVNNYFSVAKGGLALKIFFGIMAVRFILVPFLISVTNGQINVLPITMPMINCSSDGYFYSVIMSLIEMVTCFAAIKYYGQRYQYKFENEDEDYDGYYCNIGLSLVGLLAILALTVLLLSRNLKVVFSTFNFLALDEKFDDPITDAFGILAAQTLKTFLFLVIITFCKKQYEKGNTLLWTIIGAIFAVVNMGAFFGYNRSFVLQTAIATIFVLYYAFPKYKKIEIAVLVPICITVVVSMIFIKQFGVSYKDASLTEQLNMAELSNTIECYVGGPWSLASGYDAAKSVDFMPFERITKDFILNFFPSYLPGMEWCLSIFKNVLSSPEVHQVYTRSWQMLPLSSTCLFYGGSVFGVLISIGVYIIIIKILIYCDFRSKYSMDLMKKYIYTITAVLLSFVMCYTWVTLLWSFSKNMLFLALCIWLNCIQVTRSGKAHFIYTK